jgi:hypothetical protein
MLSMAVGKKTDPPTAHGMIIGPIETGMGIGPLQGGLYDLMVHLNWITGRRQTIMNISVGIKKFSK